MPEQRPHEPPPQRRRAANPLLRFLSNRVFAIAALVAAIIALVGACAVFAPYTFEQAVRAAQSAGLKTYTLILGVTGNPALKVTVYEATVTVSTTVSRDMGVLGLLYGETAQITGAVHVALGADLKNNLYGVLSCDVDTQSLNTTENRALLSGTAFDAQQIKQAALKAFEQQAAQQAIANYWNETRRRLQGQLSTWALGVTIPERPTLSDCPANAAAPSASPTP